MLSDKLRPVIEPATAAIGRGLAAARLTPNAVTTIGLLLTFFCAWLIARGNLGLAGVLLIPAGIIDVLDGALARVTNRVSRWGGFYDSICDRIADNVVIAAAVWFASFEQVSQRLAMAALTALVVSNLVPYARAKAEAFGLTVASGPGERAERIIILVAGLILGVGALEIALWVIAALSAWTFLARAAGVRKQTRA